jgi:hypothetical protein
MQNQQNPSSGPSPGKLSQPVRQERNPYDNFQSAEMLYGGMDFNMQDIHEFSTSNGNAGL